MEVHHHPQVEKKGFKEYFLEFLMIFLAVTLGFIAENIREEITEHHRAKVYANSMISDLSDDTAQLKHYISYISYASNNVDTLMNLLKQADPHQIPSGKLYWYGLWGGTPETFIPNNATFEQMQNAGELRYFGNDLSKKITLYDLTLRRMKSDDEKDDRIYAEVRKVRATIFEFKYNNIANEIFQSNKKSPDQNKIDSFIHTNPPLLTYDKVLFNQYVELVRSRFFSAKVNTANTLLQQATQLIGTLKEEYHLK